MHPSRQIITSIPLMTPVDTQSVEKGLFPRCPLHATATVCQMIESALLMCYPTDAFPPNAVAVLSSKFQRVLTI